MFEFRVKRLVQLIIVIVLLAVLGRALYLYCSYKFNLMMGYSNDCRPKSNSRLNMEKSDWSNGGVFDCVFSKDNVNFGRDFIVMGLTENKDSEAEYKYCGSEYRSIEKYGYGLYSVKMKPAKNDGVVSSFFTYTGESDGTTWDEIDIEFLGKDTTAVQFNYYVDGIGNHEYLHKLDYDASEEYHEYSFLWTQDYIRYFIDGITVYEYKVSNGKLPVTEGRIMMNLWNGRSDIPDVVRWLGSYDGTTPLYAYYDNFSYVPLEGLDLEYYENCQSHETQLKYWIKRYFTFK